MAQVVITLNLENEDDQELYRLINNAAGMKNVLQDLSGRYSNEPISFRSLLKYADLPEKEYEIVEKLADRFYELIAEYKVDLD